MKAFTAFHARVLNHSGKEPFIENALITWHWFSSDLFFAMGCKWKITAEKM